MKGVTEEGAKVTAVYQQMKDGSTAFSKATYSLKNASDYIKELRTQYSIIATAQKEYVAALKSGNETLQTNYKRDIDAANEKVDAIKKEAQAAKLSQEAQENIHRMSLQAINSELKFRDAVQATTKAIQEKNAAAAQKNQNELDSHYIKEMTDAYKRLSTAQSEYEKAASSKDATRMTYWDEEAKRATEVANQWKKEADATNLSAAAKQKISVLYDDLNVKAAEHRNKVQEVKDQLEDNAVSLTKQVEQWLATMVIMRGLKEMWGNAVKYARTYYDQMNEIRIVTKMNQDEADELGDSYRRLAQEMSVTSTEVAKAAVEFWRQGLNKQQVEERLRYTTVYAKISALDFETAAELMTAATNSMGMSADRVADVWAYLGDASASGADEIGTAMQKVSASAQEAGISFEWLGAYIATLSEKTRQAPEVIGTALNSMISRLQQIKQKGYNSDDDYGLNDISKALKTIKVELMDDGEWRSVSDVLDDIAAKWGTLDDKTKSYIATVMGGTRQRNYLLTLLNDMSKGAENGSRAWELYAGAQEAAGVAMEKYAIWEESVEAAQNRLTAATEQLYSVLSGEMIKGWYDTLAWIINGINTASEATDGWNIKMALLGGALALLVLSIKKVTAATGAATFSAKTWQYVMTGITTSATGATVATNMLGVALRSIGIGIAIAAVGQLVGWFMSMKEAAVDAGETVKESLDKIDQGFSNIQTMEEFRSKLDEIDTSTNATKEDVDKFNQVRQEMISSSPSMKSALGEEVGSVEDLGGAYKTAREELEKLQLAQAYENWRTARGGMGDAREAYAATSGKYGSSDSVWNGATAHRLDAKAIFADATNTRYLNDYFGDGKENRGLLNLSTIEDYAEFIRLANQNIEKLQTYLGDIGTSLGLSAENPAEYIAQINDRLARGESMNGVNAQEALKYAEALQEWEEVLYGILIPGSESVEEEIASAVSEFVKTTMTDALDPAKYPDMVGMFSELVGDMLDSTDWADALYGKNTDDAEAYVRDYVKNYMAAIDKVRSNVTRYTGIYDNPNPEATPESLKEWAQKAYDGLMQGAIDSGIGESVALRLLAPFVNHVGGEFAKEIKNVVDTGTGGVVADEETESDFEQNIKTAKAYLDQVYALRDAIAKLQSDSSMTDTSILESLYKVFGKEDVDSW